MLELREWVIQHRALVLLLYFGVIIVHACFPGFMREAYPDSFLLRWWKAQFGDIGWPVMALFWPLAWPIYLFIVTGGVWLASLPERLGAWVRARRERKAIPKAIMVADLELPKRWSTPNEASTRKGKTEPPDITPKDLP